MRETAEVSLVEVPVRVLDREGAPMRDLAAKDFTLFDEGRPQEIVGFDAVDLAREGRGHAAVGPGPAPARRRFLILFDFSFARPKSIVAARRAARDFVLEGLGGTDLAAVAVYSVEKGVRLLVTFTSDRAQLARAIETLGLEAPRAPGDPLAFAFDTSSLHFDRGSTPTRTAAGAPTRRPVADRAPRDDGVDQPRADRRVSARPGAQPDPVLPRPRPGARLRPGPQGRHLPLGGIRRAASSWARARPTRSGSG